MSKSLTVIINCYNGEGFLGDALSSLLKQSDKDFSVVFFDNASTDSSIQIAQQFSESLSLNIVSNDSNVPLGSARNKALSFVNTDLVSFLDVDDEYSPTRIEVSKSAHAEIRSKTV